MKPQIVNIVNFVRGCEPRMQIDLVKPVVEQLKLMRRYSLPGTFLLQYDALIRDEFLSLFIGGDDDIEIGLWMEMNRPLVEQAGLVWRGRPGWAWDSHSNVGFTVGYHPKERKALVDECFRKFKFLFGRYPATVGSWFIDTGTLDYLYNQYGIVASCNCKDQWGTDGYTIWGGYYGQAYYPCRRNMLCPAQTIEHQISVPIFRMLGSDPIYQYDAGSSAECLSNSQPVVTLEPVYAENGGGGDPEWVRWYIKENFNGLCLSFGYTQAGQENSFGWEAMKDGIADQFALFASLRDKGQLVVETMERTGRWYAHTFPHTPPSAIVACTDWKHQGRQSAWYSSSHYRTNLFIEDGCFRIRDIMLFNEHYSEHYLNAVCDSHEAYYDNLPIMDGHRWSGNGIKAGIWLYNEAMEKAVVMETAFHEVDSGILQATFDVLEDKSRVVVTCLEDRLQIDLSGLPQWRLCFMLTHEGERPIMQMIENNIRYRWNGFVYLLRVSAGLLREISGNFMITPDCNGLIELVLRQ